MKYLIVSSLLISAGIIFTGCQSNQASTPSPVNQPVAQQVASPAPNTDVTASDPEMKAIQADLDKLNTETDFPTFTEKDLQQ